MKIQDLYRKFEECSGVATDTRKIRAGSMFFALKGPNFDANLFADEALKKGARYAVVDDPEVAVSTQFIPVANALTALQQLAVFHREKLGVPIIGITGTNGKTTTKELINAVLSTQFKVAATRGNLNNHIGVPLTLLDMTKDDAVAIVEMGANHPGEIAFLCDMARPGIGLITNIGKAHLEGFGTFENIIATKKELYECVVSRNGLLFVNRSDELLAKLASGGRVNYYLDPAGLNGEILNSDNGLLRFRYMAGDYRSSPVQMQLAGNYNFPNAMAAVALGLCFGITHENIRRALVSYIPENNRSQRMNTEKNELILDAYNANPTSTLEALKHFLQVKHPHKLAILGDMLELGPYAAEEHHKIVEFIAGKGIEVWFVGSEYGTCTRQEGMLHFNDAVDLAEYIKGHPVSNHLVLLKGSRGIRLERVLPLL